MMGFLLVWILGFSKNLGCGIGVEIPFKTLCNRDGFSSLSDKYPSKLTYQNGMEFYHDQDRSTCVSPLVWSCRESTEEW
jgi:hypothetical protein